MRNDAILASLALAALTLTAAACSSAGVSADATGTPSSSSASSSGAAASSSSSSSGSATPPPAFADTTGQAANEPAAYPSGPYGVNVGSVIENYQFIGYRDAKAEHTTTQTIQLADFYNPHGKDPSYKPATPADDDRIFAADSGYANAGKLKPTALLIQIASVWCGPCNEEAATILPVKHALYAPCGGEFLLQLADSATPGTAATQKNLTSWTVKYKVDYPGVIDPSYKLDPLYILNAYPQNFAIDTTTMKIVEVIAGEAVPGTCGNYSVCSKDADCTSCANGSCGDGTACSTAADCAAKTCTTYPFWSTYESLLDTSRAGCTVK